MAVEKRSKSNNNNTGLQNFDFWLGFEKFWVDMFSIDLHIPKVSSVFFYHVRFLNHRAKLKILRMNTILMLTHLIDIFIILYFSDI